MKMLTLLSAMALLAVVSAESQSVFPQRKTPARQVTLDGSFDLDAAADKALPFFTPEGERLWAKGWNPQPVYPEQDSVVFQTNAVFRVDEGSERSLWTIVEANPQAHSAEYVYVVEGERLSRVRVEVQPLSPNRCHVHVHYVHTAISERGMQFLSGLTHEGFEEKMRDWQSRITAAMR